MDGSREHVIEALVRAASAGRPVTSFALHVGGLNERNNTAYVGALNKSDIVYADGASVVLLARLSGADSIERAPTTDLGHDVLRGFEREYGRPARIAVIGGEPGVAAIAGTRLSVTHGVSVALHGDGFQTDWRDLLDELRSTSPDIVFVGLGAVREAQWLTAHQSDLPAALYMTCGGWFGFLNGCESRSPAGLQRVGLEWLWRLAQSPRRLFRRYAIGFVTVIVLAFQSRCATNRTR